MNKLFMRRFEGADGAISGWVFWCPACDSVHAYYLKNEPGKPTWTWNGSMDKPTFRASLLLQWNYGPQQEPRRCHLHITDGVIEYCTDCLHPMAGQRVPLPPLPDYLQDDSPF